MGGGGRYPYPKYVYSPSGGWWTRPKNWKSNTFIAYSGILGLSAWISWVIVRNADTVDDRPRRRIASEPTT